MENNIGSGNISNLSNVTIKSGTNTFSNVRASNNNGGHTYFKPQINTNVKIEKVNLDLYVSSSSTKVIKGEKGSYTFDGSGKSYHAIKTMSETYYVPDTVGDLFAYMDYIQHDALYQTSNTDKYGKKCQSFAYLYAWGLYKNRQNYGEKNIMHSDCGGTFSTFVSSDMNKIMAVVYSEITNGRPIIVQVNGDGGRHFVTVVGFNTRVNSPGELSPKDLLIIDPWDGQLKRMDVPGARYLTTGQQYKRDYKGYYLLYIKHEPSKKHSTKGDELNEGEVG